jgi:hypothetical protein
MLFPMLGFFALALALIIMYMLVGNTENKNLGVLTATQTVNFVGPLLLALLTLKLSDYSEHPISMQTELISVVGFWTCCTMGFHFLMLFSSEAELGEEIHKVAMIISSTALLLRDILTFVIMIVHPTLTSSDNNVMPHGETRECVENLDIVLATERPYLYFAEFVETKYGLTGSYVLQLFTQIKMYEDLMMTSQDEEDKYNAAMTIYADFIQKNAPYPGPHITQEVRSDLDTKFEHLEFSLHPDLFAVVSGPTRAQLQAYFLEFRRSEQYADLYEELRRNEIIYERLLQADIL